MMYAYLDEGEILHVSYSEKTAKEYSINNKVVETNHPADKGYPTVDGVAVIAYSETEMKMNGKYLTEPIHSVSELYKKVK